MPTKTILIAGDTTLDWFLHPEPIAATDAAPTIDRFPESRASVHPGGAALLATFVAAAIDADAGSAALVGSPSLAKIELAPDTADLKASDVLNLHTIAEDREERGKPTRYRVDAALGTIPPAKASTAHGAPEPNPPHADIVVLDDFARGFRDAEKCWPKALTSADGPLIVHKMGRPLATGALWKTITRHHANNVVVVTADDLRAMAGVDVNRGLSWERSATDVLYHLRRRDELRDLRKCAKLIVLFETDGAIVFRGNDGAQAKLVFDPQRVEGRFAAGVRGTMYGLTSAFVATLVAQLAREGVAVLEEAVKLGLASARALLEVGFNKSGGILSYPLGDIFPARSAPRAKECPVRERAKAFEACPVEPTRDLANPDPTFWRILDHKTRNTRILLARELVIQGRSQYLRGVPVGRFGALHTIDRAEIESYGAIRELIVQFLRNPKPERPLCLAVFGPPGSGKSFGVKQVVKSTGSDDLVERTFNISQFAGYDDLVAALHRVRNVALEGKIPFVLFDEFDATNADGALGWLKYFLAPMQDGNFKDAGDVHPIGRAIFVFAGGTASTYEEFATRAANFEHAKVTDFSSRLRGFVDVMGPNRQGSSDEAFIIRRAMLLRSMFKRLPTARRLLGRNDVLRIDDGVLRALLNVSEYRHGARSMEAIFDMSRLAGLDRFDLSALPPRAQLELHVDADEFLFLARQERFQTLALTSRSDETRIVARAARLIHEDYLRNRLREGRLRGSTATLVDYAALPDQKRRSNIDAAEDIPRKLSLIGHALRPLPVGRTPRTPDITDEEVLDLAKAEHERWCRDQALQGVVFGDKGLPGTSRHLRPWEELDRIKQLDFEAIHSLPGILRDIGFELYRMEEAHDFDDPVLLDLLARELHAIYRKDREEAGETRETNASLVDFDELHPDLIASNVDNAAAIPRKLNRIGYGVRRVAPGREATLVKLDRQKCQIMAKMEHERWNWQRLLQGWRCAAGDKDNAKKTNPSIAPWDRLSAEVQQYDLRFVKAIPELLKKVGYEGYPLVIDQGPR